MCGIVGYIGAREASSLLLDGLRRLEYRGYDSAGLAVARGGSIEIVRRVGKLVNLETQLTQQPLEGSVGLGHTRWATHGGPSELNAHPHKDCSGEIAVIHNGIIENYAALKLELSAAGHSFASETDTEVVAHLLEENLRGAEASHDAFLEAVRRTLARLHGAYALGMLWSKVPDVLAAAKWDSPLVIGFGSQENFIASDVSALLKYTREVVFLDDGEIALLGAETRRFVRADGLEIEKTPVTVQWDSSMAEKNGYRHFMLKEIHEQPSAVENTLRGRLNLGDNSFEMELGMGPGDLQQLSQIQLLGCGTAFHAGCVARYLIEQRALVPALVETASEFRYRRPIIPRGSLVVAVSQSGETADTLAAMRLAKRQGAKVLAVCNTIGAAAARTADFNLYTHCGPECGVASTKAFVGQLAALSVLALHLSLAKGTISEGQAQEWAAGLRELPALIRRALELDQQIEELAKNYCTSGHFLFIGRTLNYPTALEGALKLKEISYIHAEGYAAGEMKHGPLALIEPGLPVVAIATESTVFDKVLSNIEEAKARGARIIALVTEGERRLDKKADHIVSVPRAMEELTPIINAVPLQLLAYHTAHLRGCDVDQPRNLAKSVTVE